MSNKFSAAMWKLNISIIILMLFILVPELCCARGFSATPEGGITREEMSFSGFIVSNKKCGFDLR